MATPACKYFEVCGGCSSQNIDYECQLDSKRNRLSYATGIGSGMIKAFPGGPYNYRNRMDMIFHPGGIGFRAKGDWKKIIDIDSCPISNKRLNQLIAEVRSFFSEPDSFDIRRNSGTFRYAVIRTPEEDSSISFVLNSDSGRIADAVERIKKFSETTLTRNVLVAYVPSNTDVSVSDDFFVVKGSSFLTESFMGKNFQYSCQGFFQNNHEVAEKMHAYVNSLIKGLEETMPDLSSHRLIDLYGGVGTFGIINAGLFRETVIVESVKQCIDAAEANIRNNAVINVSARLLDAMQLKKLGLSKEEKLFFITDPPRSGMHPKTIQHLNELAPSYIIYISCNIEQLAKDIPKFREFRIKSAALFDMFPQTPHSEAVVELVRA